MVAFVIYQFKICIIKFQGSKILAFSKYLLKSLFYLHVFQKHFII